MGAGTQKVEEELGTLFPGAKVLRMDADTVAAGHEALLGRFEREKIPIEVLRKLLPEGGADHAGVPRADLVSQVRDHHP